MATMNMDYSTDKQVANETHLHSSQLLVSDGPNHDTLHALFEFAAPDSGSPQIRTAPRCLQHYEIVNLT